MRFGAIFPQLESGQDPEPIRNYAAGLENLGYHHVLVYEHVLGVDPDRPNWDGPYDYRDTFHEPMVLFGYLAGATTELNLMTGVLVLPQRQAPLVAKQATEVDLISGGRIQLGVGVGWNKPEYEALGTDFHTRGKRIEEQIEVMRQLWEQDLVSYQGEWHELSNVGINPSPPRGTIPVWMGGSADVVLRRAARMADGWIAARKPMDEIHGLMTALDRHVEAAGGDPDAFDVLGRISLNPESPIGVDDHDDLVERILEWEELGATHVSLRTRDIGLSSLEEHLDELGSVKDRIEAAGISFDS